MKRKPAPTYKELLRHPTWLRKRAKIIELYKGVCQHCRAKTPMLTVHHRYYVSGRMPWQYPDWALIPVCDYPCHGLEHERMKDEFAAWEVEGGAPEPIPQDPEPVIQPEAPAEEVSEPMSEETATAKFRAIFEMLGKIQ